MSLEKELLKVLDDDSKTFSKRLVFANNAFRSSELVFHHKEAFLLHWILNKINFGDGTIGEIWKLLQEWLKSDQFIELNRINISTKDISKITGVIMEKADCISKADFETGQIIVDCLVRFTQNSTVEQYFQYNSADYCNFYSKILQSINNFNLLKEYVDKNIISKKLISSQDFFKNFIEILFPSFAKCSVTHKDMFVVFSQIIQKCIFYNNKKSFGSYMTQFFEETKIEKQQLPKQFFKHLLQIYRTEKEFSPVYFRLLFHAFSIAYENDFELIYQFFIIIIHIIGFDLNQKVLYFKVSRLTIPSEDISLKQSQEILLSIVEIMTDSKIDLKCSVKDLTLSDFLKNLLIEFLYFNNPSIASYKIFTKILTIDPVVIQSLTEETLCFAMLADNTDHCKEYNDLILLIFDTYVRLHRVESLVSKMVEALNNSLHGQVTKINSLYVFRGSIDTVECKKLADYNVEDILTREILECFSKSICQLASWQVINVFKTLLHHLSPVLENINNPDNENPHHFSFVQILSELIRTFLCSIRVAEHTVPVNVLEKCVKCLEDLRNLLKVFGSALVNREYNHKLMWSFLNLAYHWAEIYMILKYYTPNIETFPGVLDNDFSSCNISYTHSYLTDRQWCLLSERITNFGEEPCKGLLHKLYIQKLRTLYIIENKFNEDIEVNIVRTISSYSENNWKEVLENKFVVDSLISKMDNSSIISIGQNLVKDLEKSEKLDIPSYVLSSSLIINAVNAAVMTKINKLMSKQKRKHNEESVPKCLSVKIFANLPQDFLFSEFDLGDSVLEMNNLCASENGLDKSNFEWKLNEDKICKLFEITKSFPVIFSSVSIQKMFLIYFISLHKDLSSEFARGNLKKIQGEIEDFVIGILQWSKIKLSEIFDIIHLNSYVIENFENWEQIFNLINENVFKFENFVEYYEKFVNQVAKRLSNCSYMHCAVVILNIINKLKKTRMPKEVKTTADSYKTIICDEIAKIITKSKPKEHLLVGYAHALRHVLAQNDEEKIALLLQRFNVYIDFSLENCKNFQSTDYLVLFSTVLQNKSKISNFEDGLTLKFWNACKESLSVYNSFEECSQLMMLIVGHVSNEEFPNIMRDLLEMSENSINTEDFGTFGKHLKIWEAVLTCNLNPNKTKNLQNSLETLLQEIVSLMQSSKIDEKLFENVSVFAMTLIKTNQFHLTHGLMDLLLISIHIFLVKVNLDFCLVHSSVISMLSTMLKFRKSLILDRLPPFLKHYRTILKNVCKKSNSDLNLNENEVRQLSDIAHQLEKLTRHLVGFPKDMGRIAMYLIADILNQYEQVTLYPNVKIHLNNCIYSLISLCDQHAVNYLLRVLSTASTEIFKLMYDNYKKYYRFTGKI